MITLTVKSYAKKQRTLIYYESFFFFFSRINVHDTCNLWLIKLRLEKKNCWCLDLTISFSG